MTDECPDFLERLSIISGTGSWREPTGGIGTRVHHIPASHCLLVTLCGARGAPSNPGPELAFSLVTGRDDKKDRVLKWLEAQVRWHSSRLVHKHEADIGRVLEAAYLTATGRSSLQAVRDWHSDLQWLVTLAEGLLEGALEETISRAEENEGGRAYA